MIDKFTTVYPGHIDLGDMGQDATPANERRYSNEQLASVFEKTEAIANVVDHDGAHAAEEKRGRIALRAGLHPIEVLYFQAGGGKDLRLAAGFEAENPAPVPAGWLWH